MPVPIEPEAPPTFTVAVTPCVWSITPCTCVGPVYNYNITYPEFPRIVVPLTTYNLTTPRIVYPPPRNTYVSQHTSWQCQPRKSATRLRGSWQGR